MLHVRCYASGLLNYNLGDGLVPSLCTLVTCGLAEVSILAGRLSDKGATIVARCARNGQSSAIEDVDDHRALPESVHRVERLQVLRLASGAAGNVGLDAISEAWLEGKEAPCVELAFGSASIQVCEDVMRHVNDSAAAMSASTLRSAASSSAPAHPSVRNTAVHPTINASDESPTRSAGAAGGCGCGFQAPVSSIGASCADGEAPGRALKQRRFNATCDVPRYLEDVLFPRLMLRDVRIF